MIRSALTTTAVLVGLALSGTDASAAELDIHSGSIELGGSATLELLTGDIDTTVGLTIAPTGGYWLSSQLGILASFTLTVFYGDVGLALAGGAQYNFTDSGLRPYVGGMAGIGVAGGDTTFIITPMGGVLLPLSSAVALDLGARMNFIFGSGGFFALDIPVGWVGVRAFFN